MRLNKRNILLIAGILISLFCTWLFARKIEWSHLSEALRDANYIYVIPAVLITFISFYLRAIRWSELLRPIKKVSLLNIFSITMIGFMANNILPARVGEFIKPVLLGRKENIKFTTTFATVVMERIFDMLSLIIIASVVLFIIPLDGIHKNNENINQAGLYTKDIEVRSINENPNTNEQVHHETNETNLSTIQQLKKWSYFLAAAAILAIIFLILLSVYPEKVSTTVEKLFFFLPINTKNKLINLLHSFMAGLQIFENKKKLLWIGFLSLAIWLLNSFAMYILSYSFNIELPFVGACFINVCLAIAVALPQAPGFIGVFHIATQKSLAIFGVGLSSAQSYAIVLWAIGIVPVTLAGLYFLWREGMHLGDIAKQDDKTLD